MKPIETINPIDFLFLKTKFKRKIIAKVMGKIIRKSENISVNLIS
jgi:hypothetical protein